MPGSRREMMNATDRISDLPDDLLLHVMFFLTLQEAVQTCVLSQRWRSLWSSIEGYPFPFTSVHLKILALCHFSVDDCFVNNLLSYCPVLDDLELTSCAINITMFSSTKLKSLVITSTDNARDYPEGFQHLVIHMPNLVSLSLEEIPRRNIQLMDVSSLVTASIYLYYRLKTLMLTATFSVLFQMPPQCS
jgi:hypothetical protein